MDPTDMMDPNEAAEGGTDVPETDDDARPVSQINILPILLKRDPEWLDKQCKEVVRLTKEDDDGRREFMKRRADDLKLFAGVVPDLGPPAEGAKAPVIQIMCKAITHLWARTFDQVIPAKGDIVHGVPFGPKDEDRAKRTEKHLNWQLRFQMQDWASGHQSNIMGWYIGGSQFRHYHYDPNERLHVIDTIPIDDIILPYTERDDHPLMKKLPRLTRVLRYTRREAELCVEDGMWTNLDAVYPDDDADSTSMPRTSETSDVEQAVVEIQGVEKPERGDRNSIKREYYEQQTWLKFPADLGEDLDTLAGKTKPVVITVDKQSRKPVALTVREEPDPIDQGRFQAAFQAYTIAKQNADAQAMAGVPVRQPPPPKPPRQRVVYNIVHYRLLPNPEGIYGLGIGRLLASSNELANALAAEYLIGAKMENLKGGFMAQGTKEKRGDIPFTPGKFVETQLEPEVLSKAILPLNFSPPSEGLMKVVGKLEENSEIAANADILSGEKGASNETAKGMMVRNSNAMALISVMTRLYLEALKYEIKMIAHGNAVQMDGPTSFPYETQAGPDKTVVEEVTVSPEDYIEDIHVEFTADARMSSKPERISDAMNALDRVLNSPLVQNVQLVDFAMRKVWRAMESPDYEAAMGPPPQPNPPPQPQSQDQENAGFLNETDHPVLPDDNHMEHLHKLDEFKNTPFYKDMSSTGRQMHDRHRRAHLSHLYMQLQELNNGTGINVHDAVRGMAGGPGGPGGGGVPGAPEGAPPEGAGPPPGPGNVGFA